MVGTGRRRFFFFVFFASVFAVAAVDAGAGTPSADLAGPLGLSPDETFDALVDTSVAYHPVLSDPVPVVPSPSLPAELGLRQANNNLSIAEFEGRLYLAFRTAPTHFASPEARLIVLSSADLGRRWSYETSFATGHDLREPFLFAVGGQLRLTFVELGDHLYAFEPQALWRSSHCGPGCWTPAEKWGGSEEVAWDFKVRRGRAFMTSYHGKHYDIVTRAIDLRFRTSTDGLHWTDVGDGPVYRGGATEASFEFDRDGGLWAITRNEDGDATGFGSHVAWAAPGTPGKWEFPERSNPLRFDSPRMFRHGQDIYLVARRDTGAPPGDRFERAPGEMRKLLIWASYSLQSKRTALYRLDREARRFEPVFDLPSTGDTAFPSVVRLSPHEFLIANYTSGLGDPDRSWLWGQLNGTGIYFVRLRFVPGAAAAPPEANAAAALGPEWPAPERFGRRMAGLGAVSLGALVLTKRRRRARTA